jgi:hypothetical protein
MLSFGTVLYIQELHVVYSYCIHVFYIHNVVIITRYLRVCGMYE